MATRSEALPPGSLAPPRSLVREILRLTGPAVLTSLLQTAVFLADRVMLGRYSQEALASMQVQGPVLWSLEMIFMGATVGTVALVSRSVGGGDLARASAVARAAIRLATIVGLVVGAGCAAGAGGIARLLGPESEPLRALSRDYLVVAGLGLPCAFAASAASMVFWGKGDTRTPFVAGAAANVLNIVLNVLLIYGVEVGPVRFPELGVVGAALGSAAAYLLQAVLLIAALRAKSSELDVAGIGSATRARTARDRRALADVIRISTPAIFERAVNNGGYLVYAGIITSLGALVMASNQSLITLEAICFLSADGFAVAAGTIVGLSLGRGSPGSARQGGLLACALAAAALTVLGLGIWVTGPLTLLVFVPSGEDPSALVTESMAAMPYLAAAQPFMAVAVVLGQALRGAGDTKSPFYAAALGGLAVRLGVAFTLAHTHPELGVRVVWIASGLDWVGRATLLGIVFVRGRWTKIEV